MINFHLTFDTKNHTLTIEWGDGSGKIEEHKDVMTIRESSTVYEIIQRQSTGKDVPLSGRAVPLYKLPVNCTVIRYFH